MRTLSSVSDKVFYSEPEPWSTAYLDSSYIQNLTIFRAQDIQYWESVKYSLHRTIGILRTQSTFRTLWNIYDQRFHSQPCATPAYLEPWHIQNPRHIILQNIYHELFYSKPCEPWHVQNTSIFRTLVYSEIKAYSEHCRISKIGHFIKSPV